MESTSLQLQWGDRQEGLEAVRDLLNYMQSFTQADTNKLFCKLGSRRSHGSSADPLASAGCGILTCCRGM